MLAPLLILVACVRSGGVAPAPPPVAAQSPTAVSTEAPVSFVNLEQRVNDLLGASTDADQRDRLIAVRELLFNLRGREPAAQRAVYAYASRQLDIEGRARPQPIDLGGVAPIEEELLDAAQASQPVEPRVLPPAAPQPPAAVEPPADPNTVAPSASPVDALASARAAFVANRPLDAVAALEGLVSVEAATLRRQSADMWARAEREAAGQAFIDARRLTDPASRAAAFLSVRDRLASINVRFPDNTYAADIRANVARVQAELDALQGAPR